jgi:hypothetical protein
LECGGLTPLWKFSRESEQMALLKSRSFEQSYRKFQVGQSGVEPPHSK